MPWFYVDDGFSDSKPVLNMSDRHRLAACGLWVLAGSWSAKEELDGFVPNSKLRQLGVRPPILAALTDPGPMFAPLCEKLPTGIKFNSWEKWQKTRADLNEKRRENAERQRDWRAAHPDTKPVRKVRGRNALTSTDPDMSQRDSTVTTGVTNTVTDTISGDVSHCDLACTRARPDPTRPDPTRLVTDVTKQKMAPRTAPPPPRRRAKIPTGYKPQEHTGNKIRDEFPTVPNQTLREVHEDFCLYWQGQGKPMADWDATWLRWMRKELPKWTTGRTNGSNVTAFERKKALNGEVFRSLGQDPERTEIE